MSFEKIVADIKAAFGGAALALATKESAEGDNDLTLDRVNQWTKRLNYVAGYIVFIYVLGFGLLGYGIHITEQETFTTIYSRMTQAEISDYKDRIETGRIGPVIQEKAVIVERCEKYLSENAKDSTKAKAK